MIRVHAEAGGARAIAESTGSAAREPVERGSVLWYDGRDRIQGRERCGGREAFCAVKKIPLKGEHNVENVLAAVCAARLAGVSCGSDREGG